MKYDAQPTINEANDRRGAPMGRATWTGQPQDKVRVFRVKLNSGGYDRGGAYWGVGQPLYCATDGIGFRKFCRATDRYEARAKMGVEAFSRG